MDRPRIAACLLLAFAAVPLASCVKEADARAILVDGRIAFVAASPDARADACLGSVAIFDADYNMVWQAADADNRIEGKCPDHAIVRYGDVPGRLATKVAPQPLQPGKDYVARLWWGGPHTAIFRIDRASNRLVNIGPDSRGGRAIFKASRLARQQKTGADPTKPAD